MAVSNADSVIAAIAQKAQTGTIPQPGTTGGNAENVIGQIAANGGKVPETPAPQQKPISLEDQNRYMMLAMTGQGRNFSTEPMLSPEERQQAEEGRAAGMESAATTAVTSLGGELLGAPKLLQAAARDPATGQFIRGVVTKEGPSLVGQIPGILKSAFDWASSNPVKAYVIYKIAEESGIGPSGLKKVFHLFSGAGAE